MSRITVELIIKGAVTPVLSVETQIEDVNPPAQLPVFDVSEAQVTNSSGWVS